MSLPTGANLKSLDYSYGANPFVYVAAKTAVVLEGLDNAYQANPFMGNRDSSGGSSTISSVAGVSFSGVSSVLGVSAANISKVLGV